MSLFDHRVYNTFCMICEEEGVVFRKKEGWEVTTWCVNCGILNVHTQPIMWPKNESKGIKDMDTYLGLSPSEAHAEGE